MTSLIKKPFAVNGDKTAIPVDLQSNNSVSFEAGFTNDYEKDLTSDPAAKDITRGNINYLFNYITSILANLQKYGAEQFYSGNTYPKSSMVWYNGELYISQKDNNTAAITDANSWKSLTSMIASGGGKVRLGPKVSRSERGGYEYASHVMSAWADFGGSNYWCYYRPLYYWMDGQWVLAQWG